MWRPAGTKALLSRLVNPLEVDAINRGCVIPEPAATDPSKVEMRLLKLQEDKDLKMLHKPTAHHREP